MKPPAYIGWRRIELADDLPLICQLPACAEIAERVIFTRYGTDDERRTVLCEAHAVPTIATLELLP